MLTINLAESKAIQYGIDVHKLKAGTTILALTKNSLYRIIKGSKDKFDVTIQGGKYFLDPVIANFSGSTFGGSMMKIGWIGFGMHMEIYVPLYKSRYTTSAVEAANIIGDGWEYSMEWENKGISTKPLVK